MITAKYYLRIREWRTFRLLRHMRMSQHWSPERIREYQWGRISQLLEHAYANVPYYRRIFQTCDATPADIKSFEDFQRLPVLTKADISENFDDLLARNVSRSELILDATGGSTGKPLQYYHDRTYRQWSGAAAKLGWYEFAGCTCGDRCAVLWGAERDVRSNFTLVERMRHLVRYGEVQLNAFNLSDERKNTFIKWCRLFRPKLLRGYVTAIMELASFLDENGISFPKLKGIILCAETVDQDSQAYIERVFRAPSYNTYGSREMGLIAAECAAKNGLHEISENNFVEFEPIELSEYAAAGNLVITNLNNYAMPFLRYRIGDIGIPSTGQACDCGRGLPLIAKVIGRTTEIFRFYDGTKIAGEMFVHLMRNFPVTKYQFVQVSDRKVVLRLAGTEAKDEVLHSRIRDAYKVQLPTGVVLEFEEVDRFERTATGKFRFVYRETREE